MASHLATPTKRTAKRQKTFGIGNALEELRRGRGWSGSETARHLGVSPSYFSELTADKYAPSIAVLVRAADLFRVSTDFLLGRSEGRRDSSV